MAVILSSLDDMQAFTGSQAAVAVYFAGENCSVCTALFPKVEDLLGQEFPRIALGRVECGEHPEIPAQHGVFTVPTLVFFFDGHEAQRYARNISLSEVGQALRRPYQLLFEE